MVRISPQALSPQAPARSATPLRPSAERGGLDGVRRRLPETSASMVICAARLVAGRRSTVSRALLTATPSPPLHLAPQARPASWSDPFPPCTACRRRLDSVFAP
eukprot:scaffold77191_cov56-Phaeocystis_antarctica.AAC.2